MRLSSANGKAMTIAARLRQLGVVWFVAAAALYALHSVATILRWAPHSLYADQWGQYPTYLGLPFPQNLLVPDNGHRLVLPNLIAWIEILWLHGNQWLQVTLGVVCIVGAGLLAARLCLNAKELSPLRRWAAVFLCVLALLWLGNARTLGHSTELLHTSLPIFFLMTAITCGHAVARSAAPGRLLALGITAAFAATFSFGYGLAVFVGFAAALQFAGAKRHQVALVAVALVGTALLYFLLPGGDTVSSTVAIRPLENLRVVSQWLASPPMFMSCFLWDPNATGLLPSTLQRIALAIATPVSNTFPDLTDSAFPQWLVGASGMGLLAFASVQTLRRHEQSGSMQTLGFGLAWFSVAAAGIVSLGRLDYLRTYPGQVYSDRYMPWPCLFWLGLALIVLGGRNSVAARATLAVAFVLPLFAQPTQRWGVSYAMAAAGIAANTNVGAAVGVLDRDAAFGQTVPELLAKALPALRAHEVEPFQHAEIALLGTVPTNLREIARAQVDAHAMENLLGDPGTAVHVHVEATHGLPFWLMLVSADGTVVGIVARDPRTDKHSFTGYARGVVAAQDLRVFATP